MFKVTDAEKLQILQVPHFKDGHYVSLDIEKTIDFFHRYYIQPIQAVSTVNSDTVVADVGAGYGWLAIAWVVHTPARVIAIDMDAERIEAGRRIAAILGVDDRIDWKVGSLGNLPIEANSIDVTCCIEVLEHVYGDEKAVTDLGRVSKDLILLTTPNKLFPVIAHDTRLPFAHWLPLKWRIAYAAAVKRQYNEIDNVFWSSSQLKKLLPEYRRLPGFMHFSNIGSYLKVFPYYLPYGKGYEISSISRPKRLYFSAAALIASRVPGIMPNLAGIYRRT